MQTEIKFCDCCGKIFQCKDTINNMILTNNDDEDIIYDLCQECYDYASGVMCDATEHTYENFLKMMSSSVNQTETDRLMETLYEQ